jgi:hypothetical protein
MAMHLISPVNGRQRVWQSIRETAQSHVQFDTPQWTLVISWGSCEKMPNVSEISSDVHEFPLKM